MRRVASALGEVLATAMGTNKDGSISLEEFEAFDWAHMIEKLQETRNAREKEKQDKKEEEKRALYETLVSLVEGTVLSSLARTPSMK